MNVLLRIPGSKAEPPLKVDAIRAYAFYISTAHTNQKRCLSDHVYGTLLVLKWQVQPFHYVVALPKDIGLSVSKISGEGLIMGTFAYA